MQPVVHMMQNLALLPQEGYDFKQQHCIGASHQGCIQPAAQSCSLVNGTKFRLHFVAGIGFNEEVKKTLAHLDYHVKQGMWHPTKNQGKLPADFTHGSHQRVLLCCPGCIHECGRHHEWEAKINNLTRYGGQIICPCCNSGSGGFCECRSVGSDPRLFKEWHPSNPPASQVSKSSHKRCLWVCPQGHPPYKVSCYSRCTLNSGCPLCGNIKKWTTRHPVVSVGRLDLAGQWDHERNTKLPSEVTLGSTYMAWWVCPSYPEHPPWQSMVQNRALKGNGCPACVNRFKPRKFGPDRI